MVPSLAAAFPFRIEEQRRSYGYQPGLRCKIGTPHSTFETTGSTPLGYEIGRQ